MSEASSSSRRTSSDPPMRTQARPRGVNLEDKTGGVVVQPQSRARRSVRNTKLEAASRIAAARPSCSSASAGMRTSHTLFRARQPVVERHKSPDPPAL
jgi:hypothetical protein